MFLPSVMSLGKVQMKPFICIWLNPAIILIYHLNQVNWPNWWTMTIHPDALWLLCWNSRRNSSQPKTNVTITLLLLLLRRLQHWAADAVAHRQHCQTLVFLHSGSFLPSHPLFSCRANHLSPFLSEDIHQRNVSPPSLVTPASLCQLS